MATAIAFLAICISMAVLLIAYLIAQNVNRLSAQVDSLMALYGRPTEPGYDITYTPKGKRMEQTVFVSATDDAEALRLALQLGIEPHTIRIMEKRR